MLQEMSQRNVLTKRNVKRNVLPEGARIRAQGARIRAHRARIRAPRARIRAPPGKTFLFTQNISFLHFLKHFFCGPKHFFCICLRTKTFPNSSQSFL